MRADGETTRCRNCGDAAGPRFCAHCGQEVEARRGPLLEVGRDVLSDWLSLDSRLLRSLRALARPGRLSELYVGGKRAPFLRPFRLYLLASLALFSSLLTLQPPTNADFTLSIGGELVGSEGSGSVRRSLELLKSDTLMGRWINEIAGDRVDRLRALPRQELLDTLFKGLRRVLPAALFVFVPFLALGLKLLYVRAKTPHTLYLDHLVFALHYQTALFLALSAAWVGARAAGLGFVAGAIVYAATILVLILVYLPMALRRFYRQSRFWTALKTLALLFVYIQLLGAVVDLSTLAAIWNL